MSWTPKPRPEWVEELNAFGRQVDPAALVVLDEASLLAAARESTGLDEFGETGWREGFGVLLRSLEDEADLNLVGRLMARNDIVRSLTNRLEVNATIAAHPE